MKQKKTLLLTFGIVFSLFTTACAGDRALNGLIIGSGGGALVGQAIGQDSESTIIGAAVGGILGYMVANDRYYPVHHRYSYAPPRAYGKHYKRNYHPRINKRIHNGYHRPGKMRRESITIITQHGNRRFVSDKRMRKSGRHSRHHKKYRYYNH